jgi:hypothetical protein
MRSVTQVTTLANPGRPSGPPFEAASPQWADLGYPGQEDVNKSSVILSEAKNLLSSF